MKLSDEALVLINAHLDELEEQCPDISPFPRDRYTLELEWIEMTRAECVAEFDECDEESDVDEFLEENAIIAGKTLHTFIFKN
jgi:hypothetical protein